MHFIVDSFIKKGNVFKKMQEISPSELGIRNKIKIFKATDTKGSFWAIFAISQKSRILMKDVVKMEEILYKLSLLSDHNFKVKVIFIDAPLCSKAKAAFLEKGWKIQA